METRIKETKTNFRRSTAIKSVALFTVLALTPIALLFAGQTPSRSLATEMEKMERSQREWKSMKMEVNSILKKANKLKVYTTSK